MNHTPTQPMLNQRLVPANPTVVWPMPQKTKQMIERRRRQRSEEIITNLKDFMERPKA